MEELSIDDAKTLLALCTSGRLYAVQEWIGSGRSLQVPRALRKTPLQVAFATGFHSLIDLLLRHAPNQQTPFQANRRTASSRRHAAPNVSTRAPGGTASELQKFQLKWDAAATNRRERD